MYGWLLNWIYGQAVPALVDLYNWVRGVVLALASRLDDLFTQQKFAWLGNWQALDAWSRSHNRVMNSIKYRLGWLYVHGFIEQGNYLHNLIINDEAWSRRWFDTLLADVIYVKNFGIWQLQQFSKWLFQNTIVPIQGQLHDLKDEMLKYAIAAYSLVTDPPKLSGMLFWPLFNIFSADPFTIGKTIGDWLAKLVWANTVRTIHLAEQILTDVL